MIIKTPSLLLNSRRLYYYINTPRISETMINRGYRFISSAAFRPFPMNGHCFFLSVDVLGDTHSLPSLPPFSFVSSSAYPSNSISRSRFAPGQTCRIWWPFCFAVSGVICSDCSGACSGTAFVQGFLSHLPSVSFLPPGSHVFSFLVCGFCRSVSANQFSSVQSLSRVRLFVTP